MEYSNKDFRNYELYHYGIIGQKWGVQNGPPYPLGVSKMSYSERKERNSQTKKTSEEDTGNSRSHKEFHLTEKQKKALIIGGAVLGTALVAYGGYKLYSNIDPKTISRAKQLINDNYKITTLSLKQKATLTLSKNDHKFFQKEVFDSLDESDQNYLTNYTGGSFSFANKLLNGKDVSGWAPWEFIVGEETIDSVTKTLEKCSLKEEMVSYRKTSTKSFLSMLGENVTLDDVIKNPKQFIRSVVINKGFYSSSIDPTYNFSGYVKDPIVIKTICPKGTKAMYISPISNHKEEKELLLQRNTSFELDDIIIKNGKLSELIFKVIDQIIED